MLDERDRLILRLLQEGADRPISAIAEQVHLSVSACSRRIGRLREQGYILRQTVLLDRALLGLPTTLFAFIKAARHNEEWLEAFRTATSSIDEIAEVHRLTGQYDYLLKITVPSVEYYDSVYKRLAHRVEISDISSFISMEALKTNSLLPTDFA